MCNDSTVSAIYVLFAVNTHLYEIRRSTLNAIWHKSRSLLPRISPAYTIRFTGETVTRKVPFPLIFSSNRDSNELNFSHSLVMCNTASCTYFGQGPNLSINHPDGVFSSTYSAFWICTDQMNNIDLKMRILTVKVKKITTKYEFAARLTKWF